MEGISHSQEESKEQQWQNERAIVDTLADGLGMGIDEKIKDCVVALHLFDIDTTGSHEGKLGRYPVPYVDIESPKTERLFEELKSINDKLTSDEEKDLLKEFHHLYDSLVDIEDKESAEASRIRIELERAEAKLRELPETDDTERAPIREKIEIENLAERKKMIDLLELFYADRTPDEEARLVIEAMPYERSRLTHKGADVQENETDAKKIEARLHAFQAEMDAFTEFLKNRFFGK